jgi:hypothetical protein
VRRREFIALFGGAATWSSVVRAQQPKEIRRVAILLPAAADDAEFQTWIALLGVKRTSSEGASMCAFDPKRTWRVYEYTPQSYCPYGPRPVRFLSLAAPDTRRTLVSRAVPTVGLRKARGYWVSYSETSWPDANYNWENAVLY